MASAIETITGLQRWASPFDPGMSEADVARLMANEVIAAIEAERFPAQTPLADILRYDTRIVDFGPGEFVVRENDYGNSAFLILSGQLQVVLSPSLPERLLGRQTLVRKGLFETLSQLWRNSWRPELRDISRYEDQHLSDGRPASAHVVIQDIPALLDEHRTAVIGANELFGELAALGRIPRTATVFAETPARLLEIRWQGLRELRQFDPGWRRRIDETYRENALLAALREAPMFRHLDPADLQKVSDSALFETHGAFDWHTTYKSMREEGKESEHGTEIVREGDYPDGLLMVHAGSPGSAKP